MLKIIFNNMVIDNLERFCNFSFQIVMQTIFAFSNFLLIKELVSYYLG